MISTQEARGHIVLICRAAESLIAVALEFDNEPAVVHEYVDALEEVLTAYYKAAAGEEEDPRAGGEHRGG